MATSPSLLIKSAISLGLSYSGILAAKIAHLDPIVLGYHRVLPPSLLPQSIQPGMFVTPQTFEKHLRYLVKYFKVVTLQDWVAHIEEKKSSSKPLCALTFDDGWIDTYTHAYPLLKKYDIPATIFIATDFIDSDKRFWTDDLTELLASSRSLLGLRFNHNSPTVTQTCQSICDYAGSQEYIIEQSIALVKPLSPSLKNEVLRTLQTALKIRDAQVIEKSFLTWTQIDEMKHSGIINFGSHTHTHPILTTTSVEECTKELTTSKQIILDRKLAYPDFIPFCYPNGSLSESHENLVSSVGYHCACITKPGRVEIPRDRFKIPRTLLHNDISNSSHLFAARLIGLFS